MPVITLTTENLPANILAFDYGSQKIGAAIGSELIGTAHGLGTVKVRNACPDQYHIDQLVAEWWPHKFVVGLPITDSDVENDIVKNIREFGAWLYQTYERPVIFVNETLSTEEAKHRLRDRKNAKTATSRQKLRDQTAAEIILETYFRLEIC